MPRVADGRDSGVGEGDRQDCESSVVASFDEYPALVSGLWCVEQIAGREDPMATRRESA